MLSFFKKYSFYIGIAVLLLYFFGKYLYAKPRYVNGEAAPDIIAEKKDGTPFQLVNLKGNYVLLDFWGSWCGPCIQETPSLKQLYRDFHGKSFMDAKGFEIVSVGIESDKTRWLNAIERLNLNWENHITDFQNFDSPIAKAYGVRVIPSKFLLNTEGVIIGVNPSFENIEKMLKSKLK